jgi:hypothetical protein
LATDFFLAIEIDETLIKLLPGLLLEVVASIQHNLEILRPSSEDSRIGLHERLLIVCGLSLWILGVIVKLKYDIIEHIEIPCLGHLLEQSVVEAENLVFRTLHNTCGQRCHIIVAKVEHDCSF